MNIDISPPMSAAYLLANIARESLSADLIDIIADHCGLDDEHQIFWMLRATLQNKL